MIEKGIASQGKRRNMVQQSGENLVILCDTIKTDYAAKDAILNWFVTFQTNCFCLVFLGGSEESSTSLELDSPTLRYYKTHPSKNICIGKGLSKIGD